MSRHVKKPEIMEVIKVFQTFDPVLFSWEKPVPFKIGLADQIVKAAPNLRAALIRQAFRLLCRRSSYLAACVKAGTPRYGLNGKQDGEITPEQALYALRTLKKRKSPYYLSMLEKGLVSDPDTEDNKLA